MTWWQLVLSFTHRHRIWLITLYRSQGDRGCLGQELSLLITLLLLLLLTQASLQLLLVLTFQGQDGWSFKHPITTLRQQKQVQVLHRRSPSKVANTDFHSLTKRGRYIISGLPCCRPTATQPHTLAFCCCLKFFCRWTQDGLKKNNFNRQNSSGPLGKLLQWLTILIVKNVHLLLLSFPL